MASSTKDSSVFDIKKFDGSNFVLWKEQIQDILVQKKQRAPIVFATRQATLTEHFPLTQFEWDELDAMARSTICLHLAESVYFIVLDCTTAHATWLKLCHTYEQNTPSNKVFLMRRLFNLKMKENGSVAHHINDFESTFAQMRAQRMNLDDELKAIFLSVTLHPMEILCTTTSLALFSMRNLDARPWVVRIMAKLIMCSETANKDKVIVSSAMILTGMSTLR